MNDGPFVPSSIGALLDFALSLEAEARCRMNAAIGDVDVMQWREEIAFCAHDHEVRCNRLKRLRREQSEEVLRRSLVGLPGEFALRMPCGSTGACDRIRAALALEEAAAGFYDAAGRVVADVPGRLGRSLGKLAAESRGMAELLRKLLR